MDQNTEKLKNFFEDDVEVKRLLNELIPKETDFYNNETRAEYLNRLLSCLEKIELYLNRMFLSYHLQDNIVKAFNTLINNLKNYINSYKFYQLLDQGYKAVLDFVHTNISNMSPNFLKSIQKGFIGRYLFYGAGVETPTTVNEFLHYIHSYVINNDNLYFGIPIIHTTRKENEYRGISLRGIADAFGNELYEKVLAANIDSDRIDIINLGKKALIMAQDLGHATVIEIEKENDKAFVKYYIPKNNNQNMTSTLKGIKENNEDFANGMFESQLENIANDLCTLMLGIPTDKDIIKDYNL